MHELMFNVPEGLLEAKNDLFDYVALFESLPVLMFIGSVGAQFWVVIYLFVCAVRRLLRHVGRNHEGKGAGS